MTFGATWNGSAAVDRWLIGPAIAATIVVAVLTFFCGLPGDVSFVLIPLFVLGCTVALVATLLTVLVLLVRRKPRKAASALLIVLIPILLWLPINWAADCLHMELTTELGMGQLGSAQRPNGSPFAVYDWSTGLAGGPNTFLLYDVSDEIRLPPGRQKRSDASYNGFSDECAGKSRHLLGHYYVCTF